MQPCVMRPWYLHVCIRCLLATPPLITQGSYSLFNDYTSDEGGGVEAIEGQNIQWAIGQFVTIGNGLLGGWQTANGHDQTVDIQARGHPPTIFDFGRAVGGGVNCHNGQMESFLKGGDGRRSLTTAVCLSAGVQVAGVSVSSLAGQALVRGQEGQPQIFIQVR